MTLEEALQEAEAAIGLEAPLGARDLPPGIRYGQVLAVLAARICGNKHTILRRIREEDVSLAAVIGDTLLATLFGVPVPVHVISLHVAAVGIDRFCRDPQEVLTDPYRAV